MILELRENITLNIRTDQGPCDFGHIRFLFTRLETRTKESNIYASLRVWKTQ